MAGRPGRSERAAKSAARSETMRTLSGLPLVEQRAADMDRGPQVSPIAPAPALIPLAGNKLNWRRWPDLTCAARRPNSQA